MNFCRSCKRESSFRLCKDCMDRQWEAWKPEGAKEAEIARCPICSACVFADPKILIDHIMYHEDREEA